MKKRADILLVERGFFESRTKAGSAILAGIVYKDEMRIDKAGEDIDENANIIVRGPELRYVSRGGLKLEKSIAQFNIDLKDKVCIDIGSSTGGFTDCMLQKGAKKVYAIDVGYGQLAYKLRNDERVICMERTNIRYVTDQQISEKIDFISIDVSFISLSLVLPVAKRLLNDSGKLVALIKPQFEAGRGQVGKKGVVRDLNVHKEVIEKVIKLAKENNFYIKGLEYSPIKGPEGNIEFLINLSNVESEEKYDVQKIVEEAHTSL